MSQKYRIFYDVLYRRDGLDFDEDIEADSDADALTKARIFIERKNKKTGLYSHRLKGLSCVTETLVWVQVKKETLRTLPIPQDKTGEK